MSPCCCFEGAETQQTDSTMNPEKNHFLHFSCGCGRPKQHQSCRKTSGSSGWGFQNHLLSHYRSSFTWPHEKQWSCRRPRLSSVHLSLPRIKSQHLPSPSGEETRPGLKIPQHHTETCCLHKFLIPPGSLENTKTKLPSLKHGAAAEHPQIQHNSKSPFRFGELPSVAGLLLYPDESEEMETTTTREFPPKTGGRQEQHIYQCNLKPEGQRYFMTTHRDEYKAHPLGEAPSVRRPKAASREAPPQRDPMEFLTKYRCDFPSKGHVSQRMNPCIPPPDNLAINQTLRNEFRTVKMDSYPGWDTTRHRRPDLAEVRQELTVREMDAAFQADSVTKLDFQPQPLEAARQQPFKPRMSTIDLHHEPFMDHTSDKCFFKGCCIQRPGSPGNYSGMVCEMNLVESYKPEQKEEFAQGTIHKGVYQHLNVPVCQLQRYLARKRLEKMEQATSSAVKN